MTLHLHREITKLKKTILMLGTMVEERVRQAVRAVLELDQELAERVIRDDREVDEMEVQIEEECLKILALHQPVAVDLRFIVAVLKINNDLERIADQAVNISEGVPALAKKGGLQPEVFGRFSRMAEKVQVMLKNSLDALVNADSEAAARICQNDDEVDEMNRSLYDYVKDMVDRGEESFGHGSHIIRTFRQLERIADLATNISEDVVYMCKGEIIRHRDNN